MKTVPYLNSAIPDNNKEGVPGQITKGMGSQPNGFYELINQPALFRFMRISTSLLEKEGIYSNDIAVIDPGQIPVNGKIIVAKVDETFMIRRYQKMKNGFLLYLNNQKIASLNIEPGGDNVEIIGVVSFIIKSM